MQDTKPDELNLAQDKDILSLIGNEKVILSKKVMKLNHYGMHQERTFLVTDHAIYNLKKKSKFYIYKF